MRTPIFAVFSSLALLVALVFLVLATVSVPVASVFKLGLTDEFQYGLFGYCDSTLLNCTKATYPVKFSAAGDSASWLFGALTRDMLARAFVVCPIAAGFTLITLLCSVVSICFDTSALKTIALIFNVFTFLASAVACVMIVLVFLPHVGWLGWLTVAAAFLTLVSFPLLFFSVGVHGRNDDDEDDDEHDVEQIRGNGFYVGEKSDDYGRSDLNNKNTNFTNSTFSPVARTYDNATSDYGESKQSGYVVKLSSSVDSLLESKPNIASDVTKANSSISKPSSNNPSNFYTPVNLNNGPSTPVSAHRQMAPNYMPSPVYTGNTKNPAPYPQSDRGLVLYNHQQYGVFDHHPNVEGHQPFTELGDNDLPERISVNEDQDRVLESDEESHFTSVSQRPPNETYNSNYINQNQQQGYYQGSAANYQPSALQLNMVSKRPVNSSNPGSMNKIPTSNGAPPQLQNATSYSSFQQQFQQQPPFQPQFQPQQQFVPQGPPSLQNFSQGPPPGAYGGPARPANNRPTVSENALNSNPDFAIGFGNKRKTGARAMPPASRMAGGPRNGQFPGAGY